MDNQKDKNEKIVKKSMAKVAGLKSTLVYNQEVVLTSFASANKANLEKIIKNDTITFQKMPPHFNVDIEGPFLKIEGKNKQQAQVDHPFPAELSKRKQKKLRAIARAKEQGLPEPSFKQPGDDMLRAKSKIEQMFYGQTFQDNVKVQIAYNILDIKKIIAPYINDVIYSINNLNRKEEDHNKDIVGTFCWGKEFDESKDKTRINGFFDNCKPYLNYYEEVFIRQIKKEKAKDEQGHPIINPKTKKAFENTVVLHRDVQEIHTIFRLLSFMRQSTFHADSDNQVKQGKLFDESQLPGSLKQFLDTIYDKRVTKTNRDFLTNNKKANFQILFAMYDLEPNSDQATFMCRLFYRYVVLQEEKNLGVSIKKLREAMLLHPGAIELLSKEFDTVRGKMYTLIDFILYHHLLEQEKDTLLIQQMVEQLRSTQTIEEKENYYSQVGLQLWEELQDFILQKLLPKMNEKSIKEFNGDNDNNKEKYENLLTELPTSTSTTTFSKLMYFLCVFLDGKERNDLLSTMINKFENIASFIEIDKEKTHALSLEDSRLMLAQRFNRGYQPKEKVISSTIVSLKPTYRLFNDAQKVADELRFIKSITRFTLEIQPNEKIYMDAVHLLGITEKESFKQGEIEEAIKQKLFNNPHDTNLKNFILNNVIHSRRFVYLARRIDTKKAKKMISNHAIVTYVLHTIPESQIDRYYNSIFDYASSISLSDKIKRLTKQISNLHFEDFYSVVQDPKSNLTEAAEKEKKKSLIGLYLTLIYLIYKNLVNINARYSMAFYLLERDFALYDFFVTNKFLNQEYLQLSQHFINQAYLNRYQCDILNQNIAQLGVGNVIRKFRNQIAHLNAIQEAHEYLPNMRNITSYFSLYHYINQSYLNNQIKQNSTVVASDKIKQALDKAVSSGTFNKDLLHILHTPFGYNQARYKNLSIENLFDKNK